MTCVLVAALWQFPFANSQTSGGAVLTLNEALRPVRSNNRDLKQHGFDVGKQREALGVPVFYAIFVLDLKWIKWETTGEREQAPEAEPTTM
jgi:hypothetical protein